jgi:redox-sensing transcriptional repressor
MKRVSEPTVGRLSLYLRLLGELNEAGAETVSSRELARRSGTTAAQVRKDLSMFGTFGKRGLGYSVPELRERLRSIMGLERTWRVAVVGAGRIGSALLGYADFRRQGFFIEALFDEDPAKIGRRWDGLEVSPVERMREVLREKRIDIVIVAVPARAAQRVVDVAISAGIRGILNFAPTKLDVPGGTALKNVNMAVELEGLSFALANDGGNGDARGAGR